MIIEETLVRFTTSGCVVENKVASVETVLPLTVTATDVLLVTATVIWLTAMLLWLFVLSI